MTERAERDGLGAGPPPVTIVSRTRLFPSTRRPRTRTPLSILDAKVARFSPTAAAWIYDESRSVDRLGQALQTVVDRYPAWTGQLRFAHAHAGGLDDASRDHTRRYGRLELVHGSEGEEEGAQADPGVELIVAHSSVPLAGRLPDRNAGVFDAADGVTPKELLDQDTPLALSSSMADEGQPALPAVYVQVTTFEGGGTAVALKIAHALADAKAMIDLVKLWSEAYIALEAGQPVAATPVAFDPGALDRAAAGDLDAPGPTPALLDLASELPIARYDWWASASGAPTWAAQVVALPPELGADAIGQLGRPLPWADWDAGRPCGQKFAFFSPDEVHAIWQTQTATFGSPSSSTVPASRLSHLDTLVAHVWTLVCRARAAVGADDETPPTPTTSRLYYTLDARSRLGPSTLPPSFVGSPIILAEVATPTADLLDTASSSGAFAQQIRSTLSAFDPARTAAHLHALCHATAAQRTWDAFLGVGHGIFTSWTRQAVFGIGFGGGPPAWVGPVMPCMDGILQVTELGSGQSGDWWADGVAVSISLEQGALDWLVADEGALRGRPPSGARSAGIRSQPPPT